MESFHIVMVTYVLRHKSGHILLSNTWCFICFHNIAVACTWCSIVQYCAKRMQTNFTLYGTFATFRRNITKFWAKRIFIWTSSKFQNAYCFNQNGNSQRPREYSSEILPDIAKFRLDKAKFRRDIAKFRECWLKVRSEHLPFTVHLS